MKHSDHQNTTKREYKVLVTRISHRSHEFTVSSTSEEEAIKAAEEAAYNFNFTPRHETFVEYDVDDVRC